MTTQTATFTITSNHLHVLMDALQRHTLALDTDPTDDPSSIYEGVLPDGDPLRSRAGYKAALDDLEGIAWNMRGATNDDSTITITVKDAPR